MGRYICNSTVQYSTGPTPGTSATVQYSTVQYRADTRYICNSTVQYSTVQGRHQVHLQQYSTVQGRHQVHLQQYSTVQYSTGPTPGTSATVHYSTVQCRYICNSGLYNNNQL